MNEYRYEEIETGMEEQFQITITQDMMDSFKHITKDTNPLHCDPEFANAMSVKLNGEERGVYVYGMLTASLLSTLAGVLLPGKYCLVQEVNAGFSKPVFVGDQLTVYGKVAEKNDLFHFLTLKVWIKNQKGERVLRGQMKTGVLSE